jgi:hypothetical protein
VMRQAVTCIVAAGQGEIDGMSQAAVSLRNAIERASCLQRRRLLTTLTVRVLIGHRVTLYSPTLVNRTVSKKAIKSRVAEGAVNRLMKCSR